MHSPRAEKLRERRDKLMIRRDQARKTMLDLDEEVFRLTTEIIREEGAGIRADLIQLTRANA